LPPRCDQQRPGAGGRRNALEAAGRQAQDIDLIIVATSTPDMVFPTAAILQHKLGITNGCLRRAGGVQRLCLCADGGRRHDPPALPARAGGGPEVFSRILDFNDRTTCVLFGDGAGAVVLEASDEPGILATDLHADGSHVGILCVPGHVSGGRSWAIRCSRWTARPCSSWPWACWTRPRATLDKAG
jgi:3-oxoacyl-[acyl-carrier-protein] synthase-3